MTEPSSAEFQMVPLEQLHESRFNPRRHFDDAKMAELVDSVKRLGVLTPLLARPNASGYEIAAGHRRYRAAKKAGVGSLPVRIRAMTDSEFLEVITIENLQREDIHPLDEALGYQALMKTAGYDVDAIAAKVAKSASYVYQRLKLVELIEPAKKAFLEDRITAGHAILIARLQPKDQKEALESCFDTYRRDPQGQPFVCGVRSLDAWIHQNVHLDLNAAPWKKDDAELVPAAGACTTCPKRTGFMPSLFPDVAKKDTCTDRACFQGKIKAHVARAKAAMIEAGEKPLEISTAWGWSQREEKAKNAPLFTHQYRRITARDRCENARKAIVVHGDTDLGRVVEVCLADKCKKHGAYRSSSAEDNRWREKHKQAEEQRRRKRLGRSRILEAIIAEVKAPLPRTEMELLAVMFFGELWYEFEKTIARRRGWVDDKSVHEARGSVRKRVVGLTNDELAGLLVELSLAKYLDGVPYGTGSVDQLKLAAGRYGVDVKSIEKQLAGELAEKKKAKEARTKKAAAKASPAKKPKLRAGEHACEVCGCTESRACIDGLGDGCSWRPEFLSKKRYVCSSCPAPAAKTNGTATATSKPKKSAAARKAQAARMSDHWKKRKAAAQSAEAST